MTFQPPPPPQGPPPGPPQGPPPQGPPPQGPPPGGPPGNWGPPGSGGTGGMGGGPGSGLSGFDPKTVHQLDWGILAAGVLTLIFSFFDWYSYSGSGLTLSDSAWHGFFGWFAVLLALIGSAAVAAELFAPQVKLPAPARLIGLAAYALSALCMILAIFIIPSTICYGGICGDVGSSADKGHAFGFWIALILVLAGAVLSFLRFQQTGGQLPIGNRTGAGTAAHGGGPRPGSYGGPGGPGAGGPGAGGPGAGGPGAPGGPAGYSGQPPTQGYGPQG